MSRIPSLLLAGLAVALVAFAGPSQAVSVPGLSLSGNEGARLQVIHNAADPAARQVDVYLNGVRALNNFAFRTATPYLDVPAGVEVEIAIAGPRSDSADEALAVIPVTFEAGETYVAIANGVLDPSGFAPNPDGRDTGFQLLLKTGAREMAMDPNSVEFFALHGSTDAPTVTVIARGVGALVPSATYTDITDYIPVPAGAYTLDIAPAGSPEAVVASFGADLSGLQGGAAVVFASGFFDTDDAANQGGSKFGLFVALPDGTVLRLPSADAPVGPTARLQVIHNAADPAARQVDVYLNGTRALNNFAFRTATPYIDVPAGVEVEIAIAGPRSDSADEALAVIPVTFEAGETYVAIASGVLDPSGFAPNPDGRDTGFQLLLKTGAREMAMDPNSVEFFALHGSTDAPTVTVIARGVGALVPSATYTDITDYIPVPAGAYTLDIAPAGSPEAVVASFGADLSGLQGGAAVVFASGFFDTDDAANQGGSKFGLFVALPDGTVLRLPSADGSEGDSFARSGLSGLTGGAAGPQPAATFGLAAPRPNPVVGATRISFSLDRESEVRLQVFDVRGRLVNTLREGRLPAGSHDVALDASRLAAGVYLYRLQAEEQVQTRKMIVTR